MALEDIKAEIAILLQDMVNQPQDKHQLAEQLQEKLNIMKAEGLPLPEDLVALEEELANGKRN
ncbi:MULTISPECIES: hypothetical protein [unclassified Bartonella]|uniref:hypothetical protein n=1 Tax=unclassified Bartonella TaxID=2645622 RepID=UPI0015FAAF26|nr:MULTISPECIES: hypothetical protein [unclassified Bartonella]UXN02507.1 hypothetical protein N6B01_08420 [Bartonella sp. HY406]UXN05478.1 hypothetical protein N6A79_09190 [Bartonella sp. HY761]